MIYILFTGGGSGGHIYPLIPIADALREIAKQEHLDIEISFAGSTDFDASIFVERGIRVYKVPTGKLRRYASIRLPLDIMKGIWGFIYALCLVWWLMPDVVFGKGGYGSFSVGLVSRLYLIPLLIHESDTRPGLTNRLLGKVATRIAVGFPETMRFFKPEKTKFTGNPIRRELLSGSPESAKTLFGLQGGRPLILVLEGSQGAIRINELIAQTFHELLRMYEIIHQCGQANLETYQKTLKDLYAIDVFQIPFYHLEGFLSAKQEATAFAAADMIISRAGASSIYEIAAAGKPALLIPLPEAASDHQRHNAFYYGRIGAGVVIEQDNLTPHILLNEIRGILDNPDKKDAMSKAAKAFAKPDAAKEIAQELVSLLS